VAIFYYMYPLLYCSSCCGDVFHLAVSAADSYMRDV